MSWSISLRANGVPVAVERFAEGGTQVMGGSCEADLNVTYNYSDVTRLVDFHFGESLHGKKASDTVEELQRVVNVLGVHQFKDYWAPTPGNAGYAASILLKWALANPDAIWEVS